MARGGLAVAEAALDRRAEAVGTGVSGWRSARRRRGIATPRGPFPTPDHFHISKTREARRHPVMSRVVFSALLIASLATSLPAAEHPLTPRIVGDWWTVAGDPDLGELTN